MNIVIIGHSHINCLIQASQLPRKDLSNSIKFVDLRDVAFYKRDTSENGRPDFQSYDLGVVEQAVSEVTREAQLTVLYLQGNQHIFISLVNSDRQEAEIFKLLETRMQGYRCLLSAIGSYVRSPAVVLPPPPPIGAECMTPKNLGVFAEKVAIHGVAPDSIRLSAWLYQKRLMQQFAASCGLGFLELPQEVFSDRGLRDERFQGSDPIHANAAYGEVILRHVADFITSPEFSSVISSRANQRANGVAANKVAVSKHDGRQHPYSDLPDRAFWKQAVAQVSMSQLEPVGEIPFKILRSDKVATAGDCFAQHISKRIRSMGFQFLTTESPVNDSVSGGEARGFYDFSARYGNTYTARQLVQLFDRAFGYFSPLEEYWTLPGDCFCDPFRPRIEPDGFKSVEALVQDRQRHLTAVKEMFLQLNVLVYTLSMTECWVSRLDGAVYPLAPGVAGGEFDPSKHEFVNFGVDEVVSDLQLFIRKLRLVNSEAKLILTVSPVHLAATYEPNHVLVSSTYSKSVLRVAAELVSRSCPGVCYFPSFEIINGSYSRGRYFGPDFRSVTEEGIDHVMSVFMRHLTEGGESSLMSEGSATGAPEVDRDMQEMAALAEAACDEELLER
jgi:hypothetical protein